MQRKPLKLETQRKILGYFFLLPIVVMLTVFMFYPIVKSVVMSFTNWSGMTDDWEWVGLNNYIRIFTNMPEYWRAMKVNVIYALIATAVQLTLGFLLAVLVINMRPRWQSFYKIALYLPVIIPAAAISVMWRYIYSAFFRFSSSAGFMPEITARRVVMLESSASTSGRRVSALNAASRSCVRLSFASAASCSPPGSAPACALKASKDASSRARSASTLAGTAAAACSPTTAGSGRAGRPG